MDNHSLPKMSVIVITPDGYEIIRETVRCLRNQTVKNALELIIVAPSEENLGIDDPISEDFYKIRVVENKVSESTAAARVAAIHLASAPIIALAEDHCYPDPGWAEAFIKTHSKGYAVVGPIIGNANPESMLSWANLIIEYIPWLEPVEGGGMDHLPGHNSSYKRDLLLEYGSDLEAMLRAESVLHWDLSEKGHKLYLEPSARACHLNFSRLLPTILLRFNSARLFAASRRKDWKLSRRLIYILGSPIIPLVRLWRIVRDLRAPGRHRDLLPRVLPALVFLLVVAALGEMSGYAFGAGRAIGILSDLEFRHYPETFKERR